MTREEVIPFVNAGLDTLGRERMYNIASMHPIGTDFDKKLQQLYDRFCAKGSAKIVINLIAKLIPYGIYPTCPTCGNPIMVADKCAWDGLTRGHIKSQYNLKRKRDGVSMHSLENMYPEHGLCNWSHGSQDMIVPDGFICEIQYLGSLMPKIMSIPTTYRPFEGLELILKENRLLSK